MSSRFAWFRKLQCRHDPFSGLQRTRTNWWSEYFLWWIDFVCSSESELQTGLKPASSDSELQWAMAWSQARLIRPLGSIRTSGTCSTSSTICERVFLSPELSNSLDEAIMVETVLPTVSTTRKPGGQSEGSSATKRIADCLLIESVNPIELIRPKIGRSRPRICGFQKLQLAGNWRKTERELTENWEPNWRSTRLVKRERKKNRKIIENIDTTGSEKSARK